MVKFYKVKWSNQGSERDATWEREDYLRDGYKEFYQQWYACQISGRDFYKGEGCNTPGVWFPHQLGILHLRDEDLILVPIGVFVRSHNHLHVYTHDHMHIHMGT